MLEGSLGPYEDFVYLRNDELRRYTPVAEVLDRPIGRTLNGKDNRYLEGFLEKYETQVVDPTGKTVTRNQKIPRTLAGIQLWVAIHLYKWAFPNFNGILNQAEVEEQVRNPGSPEPEPEPVIETEPEEEYIPGGPQYNEIFKLVDAKNRNLMTDAQFDLLYGNRMEGSESLQAFLQGLEYQNKLLAKSLEKPVLNFDTRIASEERKDDKAEVKADRNDQGRTKTTKASKSDQPRKRGGRPKKVDSKKEEPKQEGPRPPKNQWYRRKDPDKIIQDRIVLLKELEEKRLQEKFEAGLRNPGQASGPFQTAERSGRDIANIPVFQSGFQWMEPIYIQPDPPKISQQQAGTPLNAYEYINQIYGPQAAQQFLGYLSTANPPTNPRTFATGPGDELQGITRKRPEESELTEDARDLITESAITRDETQNENSNPNQRRKKTSSTQGTGGSTQQTNPYTAGFTPNRYVYNQRPFTYDKNPRRVDPTASGYIADPNQEIFMEEEDNDEMDIPPPNETRKQKRARDMKEAEARRQARQAEAAAPFVWDPRNYAPGVTEEQARRNWEERRKALLKMDEPDSPFEDSVIIEDVTNEVNPNTQFQEMRSEIVQQPAATTEQAASESNQEPRVIEELSSMRDSNSRIDFAKLMKQGSIDSFAPDSQARNFFGGAISGTNSDSPSRSIRFGDSIITIPSINANIFDSPSPKGPKIDIKNLNLSPGIVDAKDLMEDLQRNIPSGVGSQQLEQTETQQRQLSPEVFNGNPESFWAQRLREEEAAEEGGAGNQGGDDQGNQRENAEEPAADAEFDFELDIDNAG